MRYITIIIFFLLFTSASTLAQVSINTDGSSPDPSAGLDIKFTDKGLLIPRLTFNQQQSIQNPAEGLIIFCIDCTQDGALSLYSNGSWKNLTGCNITAPLAGTHVASQTEITWNWNQVPTAYGYKWSTENDYSMAQEMSNYTTYTETELQPGITYTRYLWAYSPCGISPVTILTQSTLPPPLVCGQPLTDPRNNMVYNTVKIGSQCWMAQNLNIGSRINPDIDQTNNNVIEKYCFGNLESNCDVYGGLYQWNEFMDYTSSSSSIPSGRQGICPVGWHIPSNAEYSLLTSVLGGESVSGGMMKEAGYTHWASPNTGASNSSGFTALGAGLRSVNRNFFLLYYNTFFWSATENDASNAWIRQLSYATAFLQNICDNKENGLSVRCIQD